MATYMNITKNHNNNFIIRYAFEVTSLDFLMIERGKR